MMILDCGGSTVDAACVDIKHYNNEENLFQVSQIDDCDGIFTGGLAVDCKFIDTLRILFQGSIYYPCTKNTSTNEDVTTQKKKKKVKKTSRLLAGAPTLLEQYSNVIIEQKHHFEKCRNRIQTQPDPDNNDEDEDTKTNDDWTIETGNLPFEQNIYKTNREWKKHAEKMIKKQRKQHKKNDDFVDFNKCQRQIEQFRVDFVEFDESTRSDYVKQQQLKMFVIFRIELLLFCFFSLLAHLQY